MNFALNIILLTLKRCFVSYSHASECHHYTISGVISGDGSDEVNTELALGIIILAGTYIYDLLTQ